MQSGSRAAQNLQQPRRHISRDITALLRSPRWRRNSGRSSAPATPRFAMARSTDAGPRTSGGPRAAVRAVAASWAAAASAGRDTALSANSRSAKADAALCRAAARRTPLDAAKRAIAPCVRPARATAVELSLSVVPAPPGPPPALERSSLAGRAVWFAVKGVSCGASLVMSDPPGVDRRSGRGLPPREKKHRSGRYAFRTRH